MTEHSMLRNAPESDDRVPVVGGLVISLLAVSALAWIILRSGLPVATMMHPLAEITSLFAALAAFCIAWLSDGWEPAFPRQVGFGLLAVACVDVMHLWFDAGQNWLVDGQLSLPLAMRLVGRLMEAITLLSATCPCASTITRGRLLCIAAVGAGCGVAAALALAWTHAGVADGQMRLLLEVTTMIVLALAAWRLYRQRLPGSGLQLAAVLLILGAQLMTVNGASRGELAAILAYLLRVSGYVWLLRAILFSAFIRPRRQLVATLRYRASILNDLPVGVAILSGDGRVEYANRTFADAFGQYPEWFYGRTVGENAQALAAAGYQLNLEPQRGDQGIENVVVTVEHGEQEFWYAEPHSLRDGGMVIILQSGNRETDLGNLRAETRSMLDALTDLVLLTDNHRQVMACNSSFLKMTGLSRDEVEGRPLDSVAQQISTFGERLLLDSVDGQPVECSWRNAYGEQRQALLLAATVKDLSGAPLGRIIVLSDITRLKHNEARLHQHAKLTTLGEMAAGLIHEVRNPLTAIKGFTQMIAMQLADDRLAGYSRVMEQEVNAIERIITDYLRLSQPRQPLLRPVSVSALAHAIFTLAAGVTSLHQTAFEPRRSGPDVLVLVDQEQLAQVALNMVQNACDAMAGEVEPRLRLQFSAGENQVVMSIQDNGQGIKPENLSKLGTPFFTTKQSGTGLGLNTCYQIVDAHGGHVQVESQPGVGTSFHVILPVHLPVSEADHV